MTSTADNLDSLWFMLGGVLVFFMQAGFALLEAGSVRAKNTKNILLKNTLDACLGTAVWFAWGFALAFGADPDDPNDFIGGTTEPSLYFLEDAHDAGTLRTFFFQWAFAAAAATIVSGAVAERCNFTAYLIYTVVITGFIYPVVIYWGWSGSGWLYPSTDHLEGNGFLDFAGSGLVHMVGGGCGLMGAIFLGPRIGRFRDDDGKVIEIQGHSTVLAALGTFILWFGWYGFNGVSTLAFSNMAVAIKVCVTTTIAAAFGGASSFAIHCSIEKVPDVAPALNGILAGLVSITAPCAFVEPWAAMFIGAIGGAVYYGSSALLKKLKIDDPLDAAPVHFFCGIWGCISVGFFGTKENIGAAWGLMDEDAIGVFYGGDGKCLGIQIAGVLAIIAWTCGMSGILFASLKQLGILRVRKEDEMAGLDESHHGGTAYDFAK